ncbi:papain-like cysteine protease family protein [Amycolatopsis benzoatilytica]|uniref:papain-like cysteine protease family protein n=1 Tax=Amycolatopsis benzoatilytica TaxID=346045 RepID=UPI0003822C26|nr:papain-like cysteine protease family protein [Amycolatopsis benzoatilytica]
MDYRPSRRTVRITVATGAAALAVALLPGAAFAQSNGDANRPNGLAMSATHTQVREIRPLGNRAARALPASKQLDYSQQVQQNDEWCWAADGSSIEQSQGGSASQEDFCAAGKGTASGSCPNEAAQISEIVQGFQGTGFSAQDANGPISYASIQNQVDSGILNLTGIYWTSGGGHAEVIYGYDSSNNSIMVGDPWPTYQRYQTWDYDQYQSNSQFRWNDTVVNIRKG